MSGKFEGLIPENCAPKGCDFIGVYKGKSMVGRIKVPSQMKAPEGQPVYRFGAISDVHIPRETATEDFRLALGYFQENADFVCIAGDLTESNIDSQWLSYQTVVGECAIPFYPIAGNHDCDNGGMTAERFAEKTGRSTFYTVEQGSDVFLMLSQVAYSGEGMFSNTDLQSLYNALEENRNRRCFVFMHPFVWGKSGDPMMLYGWDALATNQGKLIENLMAHYPNALWFHGHSHHRFQIQQRHEKSNYDCDMGCHSIHIPSVTAPVDIADGQRTQLLEGSQGYLVEVYDSDILLMGMDFITGKKLPVAIYKLDTALKTVEAGTLEDDTGILII